MLVPEAKVTVDPVAEPVAPLSVTIPPPPLLACQVGLLETPVEVSTYPVVAVAGLIDVSVPDALPSCTAWLVVPERVTASVDPEPVVVILEPPAPDMVTVLPVAVPELPLTSTTPTSVPVASRLITPLDGCVIATDAPEEVKVTTPISPLAATLSAVKEAGGVDTVVP